MRIFKNACTIIGIYRKLVTLMKRPTPHLKLLSYLESYIQEWGYSPSYEEMIEAMDKPRGAIQNSLKVLEREGYIVRDRGKARAIRLARPNPEGIPIWGTIAAGYLTEVFGDYVDTLPISSPRLKPGDFALQVSGDSMIGDHILDGSFVVMRPVRDPNSLKNGEVVAALVEGKGTTLKHFYRDGEYVSLVASNPKYEPITIDTRECDVKVQGTLLWVLTKFD